MLQSAVVSNKEIILHEFQHLHCRQMELLTQLETDFLTAMPEQLLEMTVSEFLNKQHGDFKGEYSSLLKREDQYNTNKYTQQALSQTSSQASTIGINYQPPKGLFAASTVLSTHSSKSILKNSKRKRNNNNNEFELKTAMQSCHSYYNNRNQGNYHNNNNNNNTRDDHNNKENYEYLSNHNNMIISEQQLASHKNTAKKAHEQHQPESQALRQQQSGYKSCKKIWRI